MGPGSEVDLSDEKLVAYIDGELDASEQQMVAEALMHNAPARDRLGLLKQGGRDFRMAFDMLLKAAPEDRLHAMYADVLTGKVTGKPNGIGGGADNVVPLRGKQRSGGGAFWQMAAAAAILAFVFAGGMFAGGFFNAPQTVVVEAPAGKPGWREAAARYVALFSKDTLAGLPSDPGQRQANLHSVENALGLKLEGERIAMPDLEFQGTQLLSLEGKPLAQIAYLHGDTPVALCITRTPVQSAPAASEVRHGLNIVHWVANGYGFMVIGGLPGQDLDRIAKEFQARLS